MKTFLAVALGIVALGGFAACTTPSPTATASTSDAGALPPRKDASSGGSSGGTESVHPACIPAATSDEFYARSAVDLGGDAVSMCDYRGKVVLVFNGASECGYTPQYKPLETLYETYKDRGFVALGFPCNQFGGQEPGSAEEISTFCTTQYHITFPMFEKIEVNGDGTHPIYQWLKSQPGGSGDISWNFEKFILGRDGKLIKRFPPSTAPDDPELVATLEAALKAAGK